MDRSELDALNIEKISDTEAIMPEAHREYNNAAADYSEQVADEAFDAAKAYLLPQSIPFSSVIHFNVPEFIMAPHNLTEDLVFTANMVNAIAGAGGSMMITQTGSFTIDFNAAGFKSPSDQGLLTIPTGQMVEIFVRWNGTFKGIIVTAPVDVLPPTPPIPEEGLITLTGGPSGGNGNVVPITDGFGMDDPTHYGTAWEEVITVDDGQDKVYFCQYTGSTDNDGYLVLMESAERPLGTLTNTFAYLFPDGSASGKLAYGGGTSPTISPTLVSPNVTPSIGSYFGFKIQGTGAGSIKVAYTTDKDIWDASTNKETLTRERTPGMKLWVAVFLFTGKTIHSPEVKFI